MCLRRIRNDYLSTGYYPFFQDTEYLLRLRSVINQMVESDIPIFADMTVASAVKLKKLGNENFVSKAPAKVIEMEKKKQADAESKIKSIEESIAALTK